MKSAILLIAHGSRRAEANDDVRRLSVMLGRRCPDRHIECAYLELAAPTIPQGMAACVNQGAERVAMLPFFLSAGAHVTEHLEEFRQQLQAEFPNVEVTLCGPMGLHPLIVDILLERLQEAQSTATID